METLCLSDHPKAKEEIFGDFCVKSHSGLSATEKILLDSLHHIASSSKKILICENRSGVIGQILSKTRSDMLVSQQSFDHFYHQRLLDRWANSAVQFILNHELPKEETFDEIMIQMTQSLSAEFLADLMQQAYDLLKSGGRLWISLEPRHGSSIKDMKKRYGALSEDSFKGGKLIRIKKKDALKKKKKYVANLVCPLSNDDSLEIKTRPGVFAHRKIDGGAMALIRCVRLKGEEKVLEMGCGSGVVSLALKKSYPGIEMCSLDSHSVAVEQTRQNALLNHLELKDVQLSSAGWKGNEKFEVFVGNPPYFGDHKISGFFIDEAKRVLTKKGTLWLVAKKMDWNLDYASSKFDLLEVHEHGDFKVAQFIKSSS